MSSRWLVHRTQKGRDRSLGCYRVFLPFEAMNEAMTTIADKNPKWNPDLPVIMRRNAAFAISWREQVADHRMAHKRAIHLATRATSAAAAVPRVSHPRSAGLLRVLSTPAPALGHGTEQERNFDAQVRRDALRKLHCECIWQEQRLEKSRQASRDHTLAADCAETLTFLQLDTHMRICSHRKQLSEAAQKRRALELKWQTEGVEERLKERADERAKQAARKEAHAERLERQAAEHQKKLHASKKRNVEEAKAQARARNEKYQQAVQNRQMRSEQLAAIKEAEYAQNLERAWKHAEGLASRANDELACHVRRYGLQTHPLVSGGSQDGEASGELLGMFGEPVGERTASGGSGMSFGGEEKLPTTTPLGRWVEKGTSVKLSFSASASTLPSPSTSQPIFYSDWLECELSRLHARLELMRHRAATAKAALRMQLEKQHESWRAEAAREAARGGTQAPKER